MESSFLFLYVNILNIDYGVLQCWHPETSWDESGNWKNSAPSMCYVTSLSVKKLLCLGYMKTLIPPHAIPPPLVLLPAWWYCKPRLQLSVVCIVNRKLYIFYFMLHCILYTVFVVVLLYPTAVLLYWPQLLGCYRPQTPYAWISASRCIWNIIIIIIIIQQFCFLSSNLSQSSCIE